MAKDSAITAAASVGVRTTDGIFEQVNTRAVQWAKDHSGRLVSQINDSTRDMIRGTISSGLEENIGLDGIIADISTAYAFSDERASLIASTEVARANGEGALIGYKEATQLGIDVKKEWLITGEACPICEENEMDGVIDLDDSFSSGDDTPPAHPNCLVGSSLVSPCGSIAATTKRWFSGNVVVIRTSGDHEITLTPNHPILTNHGWVAAGLLKEGDNVICGSFGDGVSTSINGHCYDVPTSIEEIADSFGHSVGVSTVKVESSPEYFHGDGEGGEITIVRPHGKLLDKIHAPLSQQRGKDDLGVADVAGVVHGGLRPEDLLSMAVLATSTSVVSGTGSGESLLGSGERITDPVGIGMASGLDARRQQPAPDYVAGHVVGEGQGMFSSTGEVCLDYLRNWQVNPSDHVIAAVCCKWFEGYVYNMQTSSGFYIADGIVVHNCRCAIVPVVEE